MATPVNPTTTEPGGALFEPCAALTWTPTWHTKPQMKSAARPERM